MKKKLLIIFLILIVITLGVVLIINQRKEKISQITSDVDSEITYDDNNEEYEFSEDEEIVNLNDLTSDLKITKEGIYHLTGSTNYHIIVESDYNIKIILDDVNIQTDGPAIYVINAKNVYLELVNDNYLEGSSNYSGYDDDVNAVIYSKDDLIISGLGTLTIKANYNDAIASKDDLKILSGIFNITSVDDGIRGKDSVVIKSGTFTLNCSGDGIKATNEEDESKGYILIDGGTFTINTVNDGIDASGKLIINNGDFKITTSGSENSSKGLKASNNIVIYKGTFIINSKDDAIHSNGAIAISGGEYTISSGDDGIHADEEIVIDAGNININKCYEGIESSNITINDGTIYIVASDDGINVAGGNDSSSLNRPGANGFSSFDGVLTINNGYLNVEATGDGLDSNGSIVMNNGTVIVNGPTSDGNGALDYDKEFIINGGLLIAAGSSGMAQNVSSSSTQNSVLIYFSSQISKDTLININDVITFAPSKNISSLVVSSNLIKSNKTYTISYGGTSDGSSIDGIYSGKYNGGTTYNTFTISKIIATVGTNNSKMNMGGNRR